MFYKQEAERTIQDYLTLRKSEGLKPKSLDTARYHVAQLFNFCERVDKGLDELKRNDFTAWVNDMRDRGFAEASVNNYTIQVRAFMRYAVTGETVGEYPHCVSHLKTKPAYKVKRQMEHATISPELFIRLMDEARKQKSDLPVFIAVLYDTGARRGEISPLQQKHVIQNGSSTYLEVRGKTGYRKVPLAGSLPMLKAHLQKLPQDPECYLFPGHSYFDYQLRKVVTRLKDEGVVPRGQRLTCHTFRHHRVTQYATKAGWSNPMLEALFGWTKGSLMPSLYTHLTDSDLATATAVAQGLAEPEEHQGEAQQCPNCEQPVPLAMKFCGNCGHAISSLAQNEVEAVKSLVDSVVAEYGPGQVAHLLENLDQAIELFNNPLVQALQQQVTLAEAPVSR
jgi:integrase